MDKIEFNVDRIVDSVNGKVTRDVFMVQKREVSHLTGFPRYDSILIPADKWEEFKKVINDK